MLLGIINMKGMKTMEKEYKVNIEEGKPNSKKPKNCKKEDFHIIEENIEEKEDRKEEE